MGDGECLVPTANQDGVGVYEMKRAFILYWHGLGDIILLTAHLRHLYKQGYKTDLMCRRQTMKSHLLDNCPYIDQLITVPNPWKSDLGFNRQANDNIAFFYSLRENYDWSGAAPHQRPFLQDHKIDITSYELGLEIEDKKLEVFIPESAERKAREYIDDDYIFIHTKPEPHKWHYWDASEWIRENLSPMRLVYAWVLERQFDDINIAFAIAKRAKHRVLSSSVFVHTCDAMGCTIDVINYGRPDRKVWPLDQSKVLHIRENGKWIK